MLFSDRDGSISGNFSSFPLSCEIIPLNRTLLETVFIVFSPISLGIKTNHKL